MSVHYFFGQQSSTYAFSFPERNQGRTHPGFTHRSTCSELQISRIPCSSMLFTAAPELGSWVFFTVSCSQICLLVVSVHKTNSLITHLSISHKMFYWATIVRCMHKFVHFCASVFLLSQKSQVCYRPVFLCGLPWKSGF